MSDRWASVAIASVVAGVALLLYYVLSMPPPERDDFLTEDGPVETASAILYFVAGGIVIAFARAAWTYYLPEIITLFGLGARELDMDDRFFTNGLMKPNQYVAAEVALPEKLISAVILGVLLWAGITVLRRYIPGIIRRHRAGNRAATAGLVAAAFVVVSELFDTPTRKVEPFGVDLGPNANARAHWVEETIELGIPFLLIISVVAGFARLSAASEQT